MIVDNDKLISSMGKIIDSFVMFHYLSKELQDETDPNRLVNIFLDKVQMESTFDVHNLRIFFDNNKTEEIKIENDKIVFVPLDEDFETTVKNHSTTDSDNGSLAVVDTLDNKKIAVCFESLNENMDIETKRILEIYTFLFISKLENSFLQEDIKKQNANLQSKNKELLELQSFLVQKEKLASIGQLSAGVAHELNNPIGFISGNFNALKQYSDIMKNYIIGSLAIMETIDKTQDVVKLTQFYKDNQLDFIIDDLDNLFSESEDGLLRVTNIVKSLKDFSKIDSNGANDYYSINQGIESTLTILKNEYKTVARIHLDLETNLPFITANGGEINEVLLNIIINAVHAIEASHGKEMGDIKIQTFSDEKFVNCIIEDDGTGIPQDIITKIFDPFFTTKPIGKGTGLGLNISYNIIVNKHKGDLLVESKSGEYTRFTIKLPNIGK